MRGGGDFHRVQKYLMQAMQDFSSPLHLAWGQRRVILRVYAGMVSSE